MTASIPPSQAAEQSGFSLDTLRYYERIGLLDDIGRAPSGHRRFREEDLEWLGVLRCLRDTGMPIAQMRRYAELARGGEPTMTERLALLIEHDAEVGRRIAALQAEQAHLQEKIGWYRSQLQADNASDPVLLRLLSVLCGDIYPWADSAWACIACGNAGSGGGQRKDPNLCGHSSPGACGCGCCWPSPCR